MMYKLCVTVILLISCSVIGLHHDNREQYWPPLTVEALVDTADDRVDLAIKPFVKRPAARTGHLASYYELLLRSLATDVEVEASSSQLRRMADLEQALLQQPQHPTYSLYPQVLDIHKVIRSVKFGGAIDE
ncbi:unnamed protein product, partial [Echinostoma caproni]|uniref:Uncharacterized protein n=1 Tax=Echinostoma caproni TaxID=27848 RepID=A0A183B727_9TREM